VNINDSEPIGNEAEPRRSQYPAKPGVWYALHDLFEGRRIIRGYFDQESSR
jgi:hypothetical protein